MINFKPTWVYHSPTFGDFVELDDNKISPTDMEIIDRMFGKYCVQHWRVKDDQL